MIQIFTCPIADWRY